MKYIQNFICAVIILNCVKSLLSNLVSLKNTNKLIFKITGDSKILETKFNDNLVRSKRITHTANYNFDYKILENPSKYNTTTNINKISLEIAMAKITRFSCITFSPTDVFKNQQTKLEIILVSDSFIIPERIFFEIIPFYLTESCNRDYKCVLWEFFYYFINSLEQNRSDRDKYLNVYEKNIDKSKKGCSKKYKRDEFNLTMEDLTSFDYGSFTLAKKDECSLDGRITIGAKNPLYNNMIGQRYHPSFNDWKLLNELWCKNSCNQPIVCDNRGYPDYNKCNGYCVCPTGFEGKSCDKIFLSYEECGEQYLVVGRDAQILSIHGKKRCTYFIYKTSCDKRTKFNILSLSSKKVEPCFEQMGFQLKYTEDVGSTGLCLCGDYKNITLYSDNFEMLLTFSGKQDDHHLTLSFELD